jgi:hypothetical protein
MHKREIKETKIFLKKDLKETLFNTDRVLGENVSMKITNNSNNKNNGLAVLVKTEIKRSISCAPKSTKESQYMISTYK